MRRVIIKNIPVVSLNKYYAGMHWTKRKIIKDKYALIVKSQTKLVITKPCVCYYDFYFAGRRLDCSNCVAMVKMIEDALFPSDAPDIVKQLVISSNKSKDKTKSNYVIISVDFID